MKHLTLIAAVAALGFTASANAAGNELDTRVLASDGWAAYHVPMIAGVDGPCCYSVGDGSTTKKGCNLEGHSWSSGGDSGDSVVAPDGTLAVYLRVEHGRVERVRAFGASCPVQTTGTVRWIYKVDSENSVALLSSLIDRKAGNGPDDSGLVALAYQAGSSATRALTTRAEPSHARKEREQAIFWLGHTRGAEGTAVVEHYATTDADPNIRAHAVFTLSESKAPDAYIHILSIARNDPNEHVRSQALFWLAKMHDQRAKDDIIASLRSESSDEVREQAVFALSQLDGTVAADALISVLRGDYPHAVKKQAMFWLGQSGSPQAMAYFDEALK